MRETEFYGRLIADTTFYSVRGAWVVSAGAIVKIYGHYTARPVDQPNLWCNYDMIAHVVRALSPLEALARCTEE